MPLIVTVNTIAECLRTDCNILGDNKKEIFWISLALHFFNRLEVVGTSSSHVRDMNSEWRLKVERHALRRKLGGLYWNAFTLSSSSHETQAVVAQHCHEQRSFVLKMKNCSDQRFYEYCTDLD